MWTNFKNFSDGCEKSDSLLWQLFSLQPFFHPWDLKKRSKNGRTQKSCYNQKSVFSRPSTTWRNFWNPFTPVLYFYNFWAELLTAVAIPILRIGTGTPEDMLLSNFGVNHWKSIIGFVLGKRSQFCPWSWRTYVVYTPISALIPCLSPSAQPPMKKVSFCSVSQPDLTKLTMTSPTISRCSSPSMTISEYGSPKTHRLE